MKKSYKIEVDCPNCAAVMEAVQHNCKKATSDGEIFL